MKLTIIVVNYNGAQFLSDCLESMISQKSFVDSFKIIVFDNASTDESLDVINNYNIESKRIVDAKPPFKPYLMNYRFYC